MLSFAENFGCRQTVKFEKIYEFRGILPRVDGNEEDVFLDALEIILEHIESFGFKIPESAFSGESFQVRTSDSCGIDCLAMRQRLLWAARMSYLRDDDANHRRHMIYDLSLISNNGNVEFGIKVTAEHILGRQIDFVPQLIFEVADQLGLCHNQGSPVDGKPISIEDETQIEELFDLVTDPRRSLPVVVISEINSFSWRNNNRNQPSYILNASDLARYLRGFALVVQLSYDAAKEWTLRVGRSFSVYDGAIRTFIPHTNFLGSSFKDHPGMFKDQIVNYQFKEQRGAKAYFAFLVHSIRRQTAYIEQSWKNMYFLPEALQLKREIDIYMSALPQRPSTAKVEKATAVKRKLNAMECALKEKMERIAELETLQETSKSENLELQSHIEHLNLMLSPTSGNFSSRVEKPPIIVTYENMAALCRTEYAGKLHLLKRAERSLEKAQFESPELVFLALGLLANEYRDARLGKQPMDIFIEKCLPYGITLSATRKSRSFDPNDIYLIAYPPNTKELQPLKYQLCRGKSPKRKYRMRIYFIWSENDKLVVVGDLPQQLGEK